jgi:hypothetical protein
MMPMMLTPDKTSNTAHDATVLMPTIGLRLDCNLHADVDSCSIINSSEMIGRCVTPVLQLGWVGIDLIDSDVIILIFVASSLVVVVGWSWLSIQMSVSCSEKQERRGEDDCPGYIPMYP